MLQALLSGSSVESLHEIRKHIIMTRGRDREDTCIVLFTLWSDSDVIFYTAVRSLTTNILQALQDSSFSGKAVELDSFEQTYDLKQ